MQAAGAQMQLRRQARGLSVDELLHQRGRALHRWLKVRFKFWLLLEYSNGSLRSRKICFDERRERRAHK